MKKLFAVASLLSVIIISLSFTSKKTVIENKLIATYKGLTDNDYYKFEDDAKKITLFYDVDEKIEISLFDDEVIGKKFIIIWVEQEIDVLDEDDMVTGKQKVKYITSLKETK